MVLVQGLNVTNGIKVMGQPANQPPVWVTPEGEVGLVRRSESIGYQLTATDDNILVRYSLIDGTLPDYLSLTPRGMVTGYVPDTETGASFAPFTVRATDPYGLYADRTFWLGYVAPTPFAPIWQTPSNLGSFPALQPLSSVLWATADGNSTIVSYTLTPYSGSMPKGLTLDNTGAIKGTPEFVSNTTNFFFVVRATDSQGRYADRAFQLTVAFTNTAPEWVTRTGSIGTAEIGDTFRGQLLAIDDQGITDWSVTTGTLPPGFKLLSSGLIIGTAQPVTTTTDYEFAVTITDALGLSVQRAFSIRIWAPNAAPVITSPTNLGAFDETTKEFNLPLLATDDRNANVKWSRVGGDFPPNVGLDEFGRLSAETLRDVSEDTTYTFTVRATDQGDIRRKNPLSSTKQLSMTVRNVPNQAPVIITPEGALGSFPESMPFRVRLEATDDRQMPFEIMWSLAPGSTLPSWAKLSVGGELSGTPAALDDMAEFSFTAVATDRGTLFSPPLSTSRAFSFRVGDVNTGPVILTPADLGGAWPGVHLHIPLEAVDDKQIVGWTLLAGTVPSGLTLTPQGVLSGIIPNLATKETQRFTLRVTDNEGFYADRQFSLMLMSVEDALNNKAPVISTPAGVIIDANEGEEVNFKIEADDDWAITRWTLLDSNLPSDIVFSKTGLLTGTLPQVEDTQTYTFTVRVVDGMGLSDQKTYSIINHDINLPSVILPAATDLGARYELSGVFIQFSATDDKGEVTWQVDPATLPPGLSFTNERTLTGILGAVAEDTVYSIPVTVTDPKGVATTKVYTLPIYTEEPGFITPAGLLGEVLAADDPARFEIKTRAGLSPITSMTATGVPPGLSFNPSTGAITGIAGQVATDRDFTVTVTLTDATGRTKSRDFIIRVLHALLPPVIITPSTLGSVAYGAAVSIPMVAEDDGQIVGWALTAGALPEGLSINPTTGLLSGTAPILTAAESFEFTISATDNDGRVGSKDFVLMVSSVYIAPIPDKGDGTPGEIPGGEVPPDDLPPTFSGPDRLLEANEGTLLSNIKIGVAAVPKVTYWQIVDGALPTGVTLNNQTGAVTGTLPDVSEDENFTFKVEITAQNGLKASKTMTIRVLNISAPLFVVGPAITGGDEWAAYTFVLRTSTAPTATKASKWEVVSGTFPPTLELDSGNGRISGTLPDVSVSTEFKFSVRVTGENGYATTSEFILPVRVQDPLWPRRLGSNLGSFIAGDAIKPIMLGAYNGPNLVYTVVSGALPAGIVLSSAGTISGTPGQTGVPFKNFPFTVRVTSSEGRWTERAFTMAVSLHPPVWVTEADKLWSVNEGADYEIELIATDADENIKQYLVVSGALPEGATLNPYSGKLTGTAPLTLPDTTTYEFRVRVEDEEGGYAERNFAIRIVHFRTTVVWETESGPLVPAYPGAEYDVALVATTRRVAT